MADDGAVFGTKSEGVQQPVIGLAIKMIKGVVALAVLGFVAIAGVLWAFFAILAMAQGRPSPNWGLMRGSEKAYRRLITGPDLPR